MRRLYQKIYLTIIASLVLVVLASSTAWKFGWELSPARQAFEVVGAVAAAVLPPASAPQSVQAQAISRIAEQLGTDIALYNRSFELIASAGQPLPPPLRGRPGRGFVYGPGGPAWSIPLPDGRWLVARAPSRHLPSVLHVIAFLGTVALAVAVCAYPVVRGLTRRLERLQAGVETLGAGDLTARVAVKGHDEVAQLAESFNRAAGRIEQLVGAHRMLLANASHELRTPLSRIRLALDLFERSGEAKYKTDLERDIGELETLIEEILLASRLDAMPVLQMAEEVDLLALAAEECARYDDCTLDGEAVSVTGDPRLLRRMIRNLLENAKRHGTPPVTVTVARAGLLEHDPEKWEPVFGKGSCSNNKLVTLDVADSGNGFPVSERERVFTPFHRLGEDAKGAGLGLALVRQIARLHRGDAVVVPRDQTCFRVTLPAKDRR
jgi:two-component system, OmpR family, sensor histidine kinase RstB